MQVQIQNGRFIDPASHMDQQVDVFIIDGRVAGIGQAPAGFRADQTIDASGQVVCPGLVDLQARLREPGFEDKATIASETTAAAAAGITTLCCPPDTLPVIDTPAVAELIHQRAELAGKSRVVTLGALTMGLEGKHITEMGALRQAGCVGVSQALKPINNTLVMRRALEYAASFDMPVFLFSEDTHLRGSGVANECAVSTRMGLPGIPLIAETIAVARDLALVEETGARVHFMHLSSEKAVRMIARARHDGLPVSCSVTAHHLHLSEMDIAGFDGNTHVRPPLRSQRDMEGLRRGLQEGIVKAICSDHQPHDLDAKLGPFAETESGISALETLLPLALRLVDNRAFTLPQALAAMTSQPAEVLNVSAGRLAVGDVADVCIFDPEKYWTLSADRLQSHGKNSPFIGWEFKGQVTRTLLAGETVFVRD